MRHVFQKLSQVQKSIDLISILLKSQGGKLFQRGLSSQTMKRLLYVTGEACKLCVVNNYPYETKYQELSSCQKALIKSLLQK